MQLPPYGLCLPATYRRVETAERVSVFLKGDPRPWQVRLVGIEVPGIETREGWLARVAAELALEHADQVSVLIPMPPEGPPLFREGLSVSGVVFLTSQETLQEYLVRRGHARWTPGGLRL